MSLQQQLEPTPRNVRYHYDDQGILHLQVRCRSWLFIANVLAAAIFGGLTWLCIQAFLHYAALWEAVVNFCLGIGFGVAMVLSLRMALFYVWGKIVLDFSLERGYIQYYVGSLPIKKTLYFYWEDVVDIYRAQHKRSDSKKDEFIGIVQRNGQKYQFYHYLKYEQLIYFYNLLVFLLEQHRAGKLPLGRNLQEHLVD